MQFINTLGTRFPKKKQSQEHDLKVLNLCKKYKTTEINAFLENMSLLMSVKQKKNLLL
jgi:hypothetical protein